MKSIRQRLTRNLLLLMGALLSGGLVVLYFLVRHELIEGFDDTLAARAQAINPNINKPVADVIYRISRRSFSNPRVRAATTR